jgi:hypothetical protein
MPQPTPVYNDNMACVCWSKTTTTKGLRYIQIRENAIRDAINSEFATVNHIEGKINLADLFTKEDRDTAHFISIRDLIMGVALWEILRSSNQQNLNHSQPHLMSSTMSAPHNGRPCQGGVELGVGHSRRI